MRVRFLLLAGLLSLVCSSLFAQDFILQGCYWTCPENQDSMSFNLWNKRLQTQAPELGYAGFTYLWLPAAPDTQQVELKKLVKTLRNAGIEPLTDIIIPREGPAFQPEPQADFLFQQFQIKNFRVPAKNEPIAESVADFLNSLQSKNKSPELFFVDLPEWQNPGKLANWVTSVNAALSAEAKTEISLRVNDLVLREALRKACNDPNYDVRQIYNRSLRDATALTGYNVVTQVNGAKFQDQNGKKNDADDPILEPLLAYAYLLTNNQVGLPSIDYADYYGKEGQLSLKEEINQLIRAHKEYIFNSTAVEYLNSVDSERQSIYISAADGADAAQALVFQMDGANTPAGQAAKGRRDVIVAINFSNVTLKLVQEVNTANLQLGDVFTDVLGRSSQTVSPVEDDTLHNIANAIYIELPPRSYSIWVQGEAMSVPHSSLALKVEPFDTYAELTWEVPAGRKARGYEVEKSVNGSRFTKIAWVDAVGEENTGAIYLHIDDERLPEDEVAYRVKMIGAEGMSEYSGVEEIKPFVREMGFEITNCEQPGVKFIKIRSNYEDEGTLVVYNAKGEQVKSVAQHIRRGVTRVKLDLSALPKGVYFVKISTNKKKELTKKVVNL